MAASKPLLHETIADWTRKLEDGLAKSIGPQKEPQSNERQMQAWKEIKSTPELWAAMERRLGSAGMERMRHEMERREALADANRK